jgi:hypothetical protein
MSAPATCPTSSTATGGESIIGFPSDCPLDGITRPSQLRAHVEAVRVEAVRVDGAKGHAVHLFPGFPLQKTLASTTANHKVSQ